MLIDLNNYQKIKIVII